MEQKLALNTFYSSAQPVSDAGLALEVLRNFAQDEGPLFWELLVGLFDSLKQGLILADRTGTVIIYNKAAEHILGYKPVDIINRAALWDFCDDCVRPPLFRDSLKRGQSFPAEEVEMSSKNTDVGSIGVRVTALYAQDGSLSGALATLRSLEEIRQREREHKSLVRLASIGRIISSIAHEINNPLQALRTSLELGFDSRKSAERRQHYLQTAEVEISRITRLIGQMRTFYRPEVTEKKPTDVNKTLQEALNLLEKQIQEAQVEVELKITERLPAVSVVDYQLGQVFLNLILNALEEMPQGGKLWISTELAADQVVICFRDNAALIDPAHAASFFDPFGSTRRQSALALGLSVSREIITELGGTIEILTEGGNTLIVRLPC